MKNVILALLINILYGISYNLEIKPDTLYSGSILKIHLEIDSLDIDQVPIFYDFEINNDFTQVNKKLTKSSIIYELQFWEIGKILLPPIKLKINNIKGDAEYLYIQTDTIKVNSYLSIADQYLKKIKENKKIKFYENYEIILLIFIIILGLLIAIYLLRNRSNNLKLLYTSGHYTKSPLQKALTDIKSLKSPQILNKKNAEIYYLNLSKILKKFISSVFYIRATEMTSTEITQYFISIKINQNILLKWKGVMEKLDNVKYANKTPLNNELNQDVLELIDVIKKINIKS